MSYWRVSLSNKQHNGDFVAGNIIRAGSKLEHLLNMHGMRVIYLLVVHRILYGGLGKKSPDYRASDPEGTLKHRIKIAHTR